MWLQDISGFDIGVEAERVGLLGFGSNLIYGNSTRSVPFFTVLLRKASGAGYYAMSGMPYEPVVQLSTPFTRLAVMEGRTLAIATYNSKLDDDFEIKTTDPDERKQIEAGMAQTAQRIEADMDPMRAASVMDTDEIVPVGELRRWLTCLVEAAWQGTGYRRTKNPRIWSLHDLEVLGHQVRPSRSANARLAESSLLSPTVGTFRAAINEGTRVVQGTVLGIIDTAGEGTAVLAPARSAGLAAQLADGQWVEHGTPLLELRAAEGLDAEEGTFSPAEGSDAPAGTVVVRADTDGLFYARPEPDAPPFVAEGEVVTASATLGLVEVMKTFTPLRSPVSGTVVRCLIEDGASVTAGEALFWIRESDR